MRVALHDIKHDYAGTVVLTGVTAEIQDSAKIGMIGANGTGKTTLIRIITGDIEPTSGAVVRQPGTTVGYVPQELEFTDALTVGSYLISEALADRSRLRELEEEMSKLGSAEHKGLSRVLSDYQVIRDRYDEASGDTAEEQANRIISELGLTANLDQHIATLSGGERNILSLGRAVLGRPDLLILDEPGNHLDFGGLAWLESFLENYAGAVLTVSHNRYLLDRVATEIWELQHGRVTTYTGNYSDYRFTRLRQALSDQATYVVQQRTLARLEALVKTFEQRARDTADPAWGKRLRARRSQLEKTRSEAMDRPEIDSRKIDIRFGDGQSRADIAVDVTNYNRGFGEKTLFSDANLSIGAGERVGIVGPNGSGKTTFLNDLIQTGNWESPTLRVGPSMRIGYCAQHRDRFPVNMSILDVMLTEGNFTRKEIYSVLGRLLFEWEDLERPVGSLSGGEWNRLQLGLAIVGKATLLLLDEPTNHLDIPSREAVEEALAEFDGTIMAVSHDRYFLDATVNRIVEIDSCGFGSYEGNFSEFWMARSPTRIAFAQTTGRGRQVKTSSRTNARAGEDATKVEQKILGLESEQRRMESEMAAAFEDGDYRRGKNVAADLEKVRARIEELYQRWEV